MTNQSEAFKFWQGENVVTMSLVIDAIGLVSDLATTVTVHH